VPTGAAIQVVVAQKGAREHYLAARALNRQRALARLVTDWYAPKQPILRWIGGIGRAGKSAAAMASWSDELPRAVVHPLRLLGLRLKWQERRAAKSEQLYEGFAKTDAGFARAVAGLVMPPHEFFFGYSYASLEALETERARGVFTILDQIDPGPVHFRIVAEELARHPELAGLPSPFPEAYYARVRREWAIADLIVVNSEWSREALMSEGVSPEKIEILPLAYEAPRELPTTDHTTTRPQDKCPVISGQRSVGGPLRVLWLGQVNAGKGIHYLIEAARMLERNPVEFAVVGPPGIRQQVVTAAPRNMRWLGRVPRDLAPELYQQSDLFVLPTLSDGFAITQLEALAHGLPVITTPNCGRVVKDGVTGFIVPPRDSQALADAILRCVKNRSLVSEMSPRCRKAVEAFSIDAYGERLIEIIRRRTKNS
jgi:glycosyltransferase involved in cell wall biosynthesis